MSSANIKKYFPLIISFIIVITFVAQRDGSASTTEKKKIIVDHNAVAQYKNIPVKYINLVKKMWFNLPGESHSMAYRRGLELLAEIDPKFAVKKTESGKPEEYTDQHLRASGSFHDQYGNWVYMIGEQSWYTNSTAVMNMKTFHLDYCNTNNLKISAIGFGWCWDMSWDGGGQPRIGGKTDPVYKCRWGGSSVEGPEGNLVWGLDAADKQLTGNSVCMDTYLNATQSYADYCALKGYATKVFFTTGPVDSFDENGELGYQRQLKHDYIRAFVNKDSSRILFDFADILAWNDAGVEYTETWNGHRYQKIHPDNAPKWNNTDTGHIGSIGALRVGKAVWWMLARIAGWDG